MAFTTLVEMAGDLKNVYGQLEIVLPQDAILQDMYDFESGDMSPGGAFVEAALVSSSWSLTFTGSNSDPVYNLTDGPASVVIPVTIQPSTIVLGDKIKYNFFDAAPEKGKKAFLGANALIGENLSTQARRVLEVSLLTGQSGWATVATVPDSTHVTITAASLRPGVLAFLQNALVDVIRAGQIIADGTSGAVSGGIQVTGVNIDTATLTFTAAPQCGSSGASLQAGDVLVFHTAAGATTGNAATNVAWREMVGLEAQASATSGTIFGVNRATYLSMQGNNMSNVGPISAGAILKASAKAVARGFQGDMDCILSPLSWSDLNSRVIAQQVFMNGGDAENKQGADSIKLRGQGVKINVVPHPMESDGQFLLLPKANVSRIGYAYASEGPGGAADLTFAIAGTDLRYVLPLSGQDAVAVQCRSSQAGYLSKPAFAVLATGVTH